MNKFKNFLECYLAISYAYNKLPKETSFDAIVREFKATESTDAKMLLCAELEGIIATGNYEKLVPYVNKHGGKSMNAKDVEELIKDLLDAFSGFTENKELSRNEANLNAVFTHFNKNNVAAFLDDLRTRLRGVVIWLELSEFPSENNPGTCYFKLRSEHGKNLSLLTIARIFNPDFKCMVAESFITQLMLSRSSGDLPKNKDLLAVYLQLL